MEVSDRSDIYKNQNLNKYNLVSVFSPKPCPLNQDLQYTVLHWNRALSISD